MAESRQGTSGALSPAALRVDHHHAAILADFYRQVWDPEATADLVRQAREEAATANPAVPGEDVPTFAFVAEGRVLGHVTTIPVRLWGGGAVQPAHWVKGLMVLPEFRNGPVGFLVLKEAVQHLGEAMALVVQPPARRLFEALGFKDVGVLPNYLRVLRPGRLLQRVDYGALGFTRLPLGARLLTWLARRPGGAAVIGKAITIILGAWSSVAGRARRSAVTFSTEAPDASECDRLWDEARHELLASPGRDGRYLRWRYGAAAGASYTFVTVRDRSRLVALAVVRAPSAEIDPRLQGIRIATLSDLIFPPHDSRSGLAALAGAEAVAGRLAADALLCSASHRSIAPLLRRRAFVRLDGTLHFLVRTKGGGRPLPQALGDWWLTRGDSYADGV